MSNDKKRPVIVGVFLILFFSVLTLAIFTFQTRPIVIGFSGNLTGRNSEVGVAARNGALMALDEINGEGGINGRKLEIKIVDDEFSDATAKKADAALLKSGVFAIIGHLTSNTGIAVKDNYTSGKYVYLSPLVSTDTLSGADDYFFRVIGSNKMQGELLAHYGVEVDAIKKFAIIYEDTNSAYTKQLVDFSEAQIIALGGEISKKAAFVSDKTKDLLFTANSVMSTNPEGVIIVSAGMDTAILSQNLRRINPHVKLYAGTYATTPDLFSLGGTAVEGLVAVTIYSEEDFNGPLKDFTVKYETRYNKKPDFSAANSYISVKALAKALKITKAFNPEALKKALLSADEYDGLVGPFKFDKYGDVSRSYCLIKVTNGQFKKVK